MEDEKEELNGKKDYHDNSFINIFKSRTNRIIIYVLAALFFFFSGLCLGNHLSESPEANNFRGHKQFGSRQFNGQQCECGHKYQQNNNDNQRPAADDSNDSDDETNQPNNQSENKQPQLQKGEVRIQDQAVPANTDNTSTK